MQGQIQVSESFLIKQISTESDSCVVAGDKPDDQK